MRLALRSDLLREVRIIREVLKRHAKLRLRTKFLLSLVMIISGLTCATLLVMRHSAQVQMQGEIQQAAHNAILTFQVVQQQHQIALSQKADLLATLASLRSGDASTIRDASEDPWGSGDCDLFVIADRTAKITALHTRISDFTAARAERSLVGSLIEESSTGWWFSGSNLYQVVLQPFYEDLPRKRKFSGTVVVGRILNSGRASDLAGR